jgi:catechol 2,3-dioxygenase-like lactoylglutathione lyase family enzyme
MFPTTETTLTHILVVSDPGRSKRWYEGILGATVYREYGSSVVLSFAGSWLLLVEGGGPTEDKPNVTLAPPADRNRRDNLFTIRVDDCEATYECCAPVGARSSRHRSDTMARRAASSATRTATSSSSVSTGR